MAALPNQLADEGLWSSLFAATPRNEFFAALFILGIANGLGPPVIQSIMTSGLVSAFFGTFAISLIVWVASFVGIRFIYSDRAERLHSSDIVAGAGFLAAVILPVRELSWLAIAALSLYILLFPSPSLCGRRGAIILLATTIPMLWSRMLFHFFANRILAVDAWFVGWVLGTPRIGNVVSFADHSGTLVIMPACSSLANMSLALLCWVTISQSVRHQWQPADTLWCLLACVSVLAVNVTRMSIMGLSQSYFEFVHSEWGDEIANVIILSFIVGISLLGVRRDLPARV